MLARRQSGGRERILAAAAELFHRRGYRRTSIEDILARARVATVSNFYYHFPSKEALTVEVIDRWANGYEKEILQPSLSNRALSPLGRLQLLFDLMDQHLRSRRYRDGCPLGNLAAEVADTAPQLRARVVRTFRRWQSSIQACWQEAIRAREVPLGTDPGTAAAFTVAAFQGACAMSRLFRSPEPFQSVRRLPQVLASSRCHAPRSRRTTRRRKKREALGRHAA